MKLSKNQKGNALSQSKGFTLVELLVVIGILAVLLAITLIAINPARQFAQANNTQRSNDVNTILNAVNQFMADNKGSLPTGLVAGDADKAIASDDGVDPAETGAEFCNALVPTYVAALPVDPQNGAWVSCANYNTDYAISVSAENRRVTVEAVAEQVGSTTPVISVTR